MARRWLSHGVLWHPSREIAQQAIAEYLASGRHFSKLSSGPFSLLLIFVADVLHDIGRSSRLSLCTRLYILVAPP
jgi:hypothetical protein